MSVVVFSCLLWNIRLTHASNHSQISHKIYNNLLSFCHILCSWQPSFSLFITFLHLLSQFQSVFLISVRNYIQCYKISNTPLTAKSRQFCVSSVDSFHSSSHFFLSYISSNNQVTKIQNTTFDVITVHNAHCKFSIFFFSLISLAVKYSNFPSLLMISSLKLAEFFHSCF